MSTFTACFSMQMVNALQIFRICRAAGRILDFATVTATVSSTSVANAASLAAMRRWLTGGMPPQRFLASALNERGLPGIIRLLSRDAGDVSDAEDRGQQTATYIRTEGGKSICGPLGKKHRAPGPPDLSELHFSKQTFISYFNGGYGKYFGD